MVSVPLQQQIICPFWGENPGSVETDNSTYLDLNEGISLFPIMQFL